MEPEDRKPYCPDIDVDGVIGISAGNFDGKLGDKIYNLLDILK